MAQSDPTIRGMEQASQDTTSQSTAPEKTTVISSDVEKQDAQFLQQSSTSSLNEDDSQLGSRWISAFCWAYQAVGWILFLGTFVFPFGFTAPQSPFKVSTLPITIAMILMTRATYLKVGVWRKSGSQSWSSYPTEYFVVTALSFVLAGSWLYFDMMRQRDTAIAALEALARIFEKHAEELRQQAFAKNITMQHN